MKRLSIQCILLIFYSLISSTLVAQIYTQTQIDELLVNKWYAHVVGEPDAKVMNPSVKTEDITFMADGKIIVHIKARSGGVGQSVEGKWTYNQDTGMITSSFEMQGMTKTDSITIKELTSENLILIFRNKSVGYKLVPQDSKNKVLPKIKKAPLVVVSDSTINLDTWNGVYPFSQKTVYDANGNSETVASSGVIVILKIDGKRILRISDDGIENEYVVIGGSEIANEKHYGIDTNDPDMAGEFVFRKDGSIYFYSDKDGSTTDFK